MIKIKLNLMLMLLFKWSFLVLLMELDNNVIIHKHLLINIKHVLNWISLKEMDINWLQQQCILIKDLVEIVVILGVVEILFNQVLLICQDLKMFKLTLIKMEGLLLIKFKVM